MKWDLDELEGIYWVASEAAYSLTYGMKKIFGYSLTRNVVIITDKGLFKWYTLVKELKEVGLKCLESFKDRSFRDKIIKGLKKAKEKLDKLIIEYQKKDLSKLSVEELFDYLKSFTSLYKASLDYSFFFESFDYIFDVEFKKVFEKYNLSSQELIDISSVPSTSYLSIEEQKLIKIAIKDGDLKEHLKDYEWFAAGHSGKKKININYFRQRIKDLEKKDLEKELKHLQDIEKSIREKKKKVMIKHDFDNDALTMIDIVDEIAPLHDVRKESFVKTIFYCDDLREEIGKRTGYTLREMQLFEYKELLPLKDGKKLDKNELRKRKEFVFLDVDTKKGVFKTHSGRAAKKLLDREEEFKKEYVDVDRLEGTCASVGKARGFVKVIFGPSKLHKMEKDNILVTGMTRPEMLPAMKKAAAIVTDEGGITSHAAIISRELKVPCVIGTVIATKVFKDGDLVEVDADKGIIKRIK